jgi:formylglycine-generating enzyme required for sulfatase activity
VEYGGKVNRPNLPADKTISNGMEFIGWYTNTSFGSNFKFAEDSDSNTITTATSVYARWVDLGGVSVSITSPTYTTLSFAHNGSAISSIYLDYEGSLTLSATITGASTFQWYVDGVADSTYGKTSTYIYTPADASATGHHNIGLTVSTPSGASYSGNLSVIVTNDQMVTILPYGQSVNYTQEGWYGENTSQTYLDYDSQTFLNPLSSPYKIAKTEVSYELWSTVLTWAQDPNHEFIFSHIGISAGNNGNNYPVVNISANDAMVWCNAYSEMLGLQPCYSLSGSEIKSSISLCDNSNISCDFTKNGFRLPTEGEWQYAASCGGYYAYNHISGDTDPINTSSSYQTYAAITNGGFVPINEKIPNIWGMHNMSGNAWEVCFDYYTEWPSSVSTEYVNNSVPVSSPQRVSRGGSAGTHTYASATVGARSSTIATGAYPDQGFRLAQTITSGN